MASRQLLAVAGLLERTSDEFRAELVRMADGLGLDPDWITACMSFETGHTFDPAKRNPVSGATGLIQFCPWTYAHPEQWPSTDELATMSAVAQLVWVERYFQPMASKIHSATQCYLAIFGGLGKAEGEAIYSAPSREYEQNRSLDRDGKGYITPGDAARPVLAILAAAQARPRIVVELDGASPKPAAESSGSGLIGASLGLGLLWAIRRWLGRGR